MIFIISNRCGIPRRALACVHRAIAVLTTKVGTKPDANAEEGATAKTAFTAPTMDIADAGLGL